MRSAAWRDRGRLQSELGAKFLFPTGEQPGEEERPEDVATCRPMPGPGNGTQPAHPHELARGRPIDEFKSVSIPNVTIVRTISDETKSPTPSEPAKGLHHALYLEIRERPDQRGVRSSRHRAFATACRWLHHRFPSSSVMPQCISSSLAIRTDRNLGAVARAEDRGRYCVGHGADRLGAPARPGWGPRHLPDAIASLEGQTFEDFEVLAVDDGSTDATRQSCWRAGRPVTPGSTWSGRMPAGIIPALERGPELLAAGPLSGPNGCR